MIGAIDEARGKAKTGKPVAKGEPEPKTEAKGGPQLAADCKPTAKSEPQPKPERKPKPEVEHAAADTHES
jgi:hypothetical protein